MLCMPGVGLGQFDLLVQLNYLLYSPLGVQCSIHWLTVILDISYKGNTYYYGWYNTGSIPVMSYDYYYGNFIINEYCLL